MDGRAIRAQSGLEYLTTYGWALLILVIVAAIMWGMGVFDSISLVPSQNSGGGFGSFIYQDHIVSTGGGQIKLFNGLTRSLQVTAVEVGKDDEVANTGCNTGLPVDIGPNGNLTVVCLVQPQGGLGEAGSPYDFSVIISFTDSVSGGSHVDRGYINGRMEG